MKNFKLILAAFLMTSAFAVSAQETLEQKATAQTDQMAVQLSLTEEQKAQIQQINLGVMQKNDALDKDASMNADVKVEQKKYNDQARIDLINNVLNEEQKAKFAESNAKSKGQIQRTSIKQLPKRDLNISAPASK